MAAPPLPPSADSLSFSAAMFTNQISSWIPADFGRSYTNGQSSRSGPTVDSMPLQTDFERGERLGLGHASLLVPAAQRKAQVDGASGGAALEKLLKQNNVKGKGRQEEEQGVGKLDGGEQEQEADVEEEEESRGSIGKKRKIERVDLLSGKKKKKAKAKGDIETKSAPLPSASTCNTNVERGTPANDMSSEVNSPPAKEKADEDRLQVEKDEEDTSPGAKLGAGTSLLTKNQRKKMRKKQKKLAQEVSA